MAEHPSSDVKAVHVRILGRVQRVGFRFWTIDEASRRGLDGWVRNRLDGSFEAIFIGRSQDVDDILRACGEGPPAALVNCVIESEVDEAVKSSLVGEGFSARQTG